MKLKLDWAQVLKEYKANSDEMDYICHRSPTFLSAWNQPSSRRAIWRLAEEFLGDAAEDELVAKSYLAVQYCALFIGADEKNKIRPAFLRWCVKNQKATQSKATQNKATKRATSRRVSL